MPYRGVLRVDLKVLGTEYKALPAFVVPDSDYRSSVPLQAVYGQQFLQSQKAAFRVVYSPAEGEERRAK